MNQKAPYQSTIKDWYTNNIRLTHSRNHFEGSAQHFGHSDADTVRLHFGLEGDYQVDYLQQDRQYDLAGGHQNLFYSKAFDMQFVNKTPVIETFGIQFPKTFFLNLAQHAGESLQRFAEKIDQGENAFFSNQWAPISTASEQVIHSIIHSDFHGELQQLFLLSKSIELLVHSVESFDGDNKQHKTIKDKADLERVIAARDMINTRLTNPPTLSEIARHVGLNEWKLKKGFREVFGNTVFGYLTEQRLDMASRLLKNTTQSVAGVAYELGYLTPQHFNNAFRKKYGHSPNLVRKNP